MSVQQAKPIFCRLSILTQILSYILCVNRPVVSSFLVYCSCMTYVSNSFGSDGETFISADDLRINLWNLEISNQSFNIVDVKPANMEDLTGESASCIIYIEGVRSRISSFFVPESCHVIKHNLSSFSKSSEYGLVLLFVYYMQLQTI